jgi:hypothetical protein
MKRPPQQKDPRFELHSQPPEQLSWEKGFSGEGLFFGFLSP